MALHLCLNADGTGVVSEMNPLQTKHTSNGEASTIPVYIFNDGKRAGVPNDTNPPPLIYTNLQIGVEGVEHKLASAISPSISDVTLNFDSVEGWNIGTIIKSGLERMRVEELLSASSVRVQRNYTADNKPSTSSGHSVGAIFIADATTVALALPSSADPSYANPGGFLSGGQALTLGLDPTILTQAMDSLDSTKVVKSNSGGKYHVGSLIKIDDEVMKVTNVSNNDVTVIRGYNGTTRQSHNQNATIYCVGIVDKGPVTHKFFIKNDPPSGLPTQKKADVRIVIMADEEPI